MLVQQLAACFWRERRATQAENGFARCNFAAARLRNKILGPGDVEGPLVAPHLRLPSESSMNLLLRYVGANRRQVQLAVKQLEELQRARKQQEKAQNEKDN